MRVWLVAYTGLTDSDLIYQHPTDAQLVAYARKYFTVKDRMLSNSP